MLRIEMNRGQAYKDDFRLNSDIKLHAAQPNKALKERNESIHAVRVVVTAFQVMQKMCWN